VAELVAARDVTALATPEEAAQWRKLEQLVERTAALPPGTQRDALAERARLLRGTLAWQLDADYKLRLSRLRTSLAETDAALAEARRRRALVEEAGDLAPRSTEGFAGRVRGIERRVERLQPAIGAAAAAQERLLADIAVRELEAQKARLASYATQAQFALAALYDGASAGGAR
jgi:chromosome segregation ATPase